MSDEIPGSPRQSTQQKQKRKRNSQRLSGTKKLKSNTSSISTGCDVQNENNTINLSQSQPVSQNIISEALDTIDSSNNIDANSRKKSAPRVWTHRDIFANALLLEKANSMPVVSSNRPIACNPTMSGFLTVSQIIKIVKLDESKSSSNVPSNTMIESQCDITDTQFSRVADEVEKNFDVRGFSQHDTKNIERISDSKILENINEISLNGIAQSVESNEVQTTVTHQHPTNVQSILNDWPNGDSLSPVKMKDNQCDKKQISPRVLKNFSKRIKKTYSHIRLQEFNIRSPSASSCSEIDLGSDDEVIVQQNTSFEEPTAVNVNSDVVIDLNSSTHVINNIQNLSNYYSQSTERPDGNAVNDLKFGEAIDLEEDISNRVNTSLEDFDTFSSDSNDSSYVRLHLSVWCEKSSDENQNLEEQNLDFVDDDDLFANYKTQYNEPNVKQQEAVASTSASALKHCYPLYSKTPQAACSKSIKMNHSNSLDDCADSMKHLPTSSLVLSNKKSNFDSLFQVPAKHQGFRTASVAAIQTSKMETKTTKSLFDDIDQEFGIETETTNVNVNPPFACFSTVWGKQIPVSKAKMTNNLFNDIQREFEMIGLPNEPSLYNPLSSKSTDKSPNFEDSGNEVKLPFASFSTAAIFKDKMMEKPHSSVTEPILCTSANLFSKDHVNKDDDLKTSTGSFREVANSNMEVQRVLKENPSNLKHDSMLNSEDAFAKPSPLRRELFINGLRKFEVEQSKENLNVHSPVQVNYTEIEKRKNQSPKKISGHSDFVTPRNNMKTWTQEVRESTEVFIEDDQSCFVNNDNSMGNLSDGFHGFAMALIPGSSTPIQTNNNYRNRPRQIRLVERFDDIAREECAELDNENDKIKFEVPENIVTARNIAMKDQYRSMTNKANVSPLQGTLYMNKLISSKRSWTDFVENGRPLNGVSHPKVSSNILTLTSENATKYQFNAWDLYSEEFCRENIEGIRLYDDINVFMDGNCRIRLTQISNAFLSCPTVYPKLIHDKWIENSFRWILIKLAGMERSFPNKFGGKVLTLENTMLQLKYRYDREIDHVERSPIRKICEMDDIPAKRMALFVASINVSSNGVYELELSDGWYSLLSTLDNRMSAFVTNGKIKVGTKLMIQGAELIGLCDGCHPLDVPSNVRLNIYANSTRRARWDSTLGYCKNTGPFLISLSSVLGDGGSISKLRVCILRVYPIVYLDRGNNSSLYSEKVEKRRTMNDEKNHFNIVENVYDEVCRDYENEEKSQRATGFSKTMLKQTNISKITDPEILYELLENDIDNEYKMTESQRAMVTEYKLKLNSSRNDVINQRVQEKLASIKEKRRKSTALLNFKITDEKSFDKTAIVFIWNPSEDDLLMIGEGSIIEITNSKARGIKNSELQIYSGKSSIVKKLDSGRCQLPEFYRRRHLSILEIHSIVQPLFNELDTIGVVILIGETLQKLQLVYIADSDYNILCINFWGDLKAHAYDDIIQPKRILAAQNLQWRSMSNSTRIRNTFVTAYSIFTENPKSSEHFDALTNLKKKFETINMDEYLNTCTKKIFEMKSSKSSTLIQSSSMLTIQSPAIISLPKTPSDISRQSDHSALSNQSRIDRLNRYGDPMATPPLHIKSLNRKFKSPMIE